MYLPALSTHEQILDYKYAEKVKKYICWNNAEFRPDIGHPTEAINEGRICWSNDKVTAWSDN